MGMIFWLFPGLKQWISEMNMCIIRNYENCKKNISHLICYIFITFCNVVSIFSGCVSSYLYARISTCNRKSQFLYESRFYAQFALDAILSCRFWHLHNFNRDMAYKFRKMAKVLLLDSIFPGNNNGAILADISITFYQLQVLVP